MSLLSVHWEMNYLLVAGYEALTKTEKGFCLHGALAAVVPMNQLH